MSLVWEHFTLNMKKRHYLQLLYGGPYWEDVRYARAYEAETLGLLNVVDADSDLSSLES